MINNVFKDNGYHSVKMRDLNKVFKSLANHGIKQKQIDEIKGKFVGNKLGFINGHQINEGLRALNSTHIAGVAKSHTNTLRKMLGDHFSSTLPNYQNVQSKTPLENKGVNKMFGQSRPLKQ